MPNWVDNDLKIYGSDEDLKKLKELVTNKDGDFDFKKIIPPPDHPDYNNENIALGSASAESPFNWYNWNIINWGTKWNACESVIGEVESGLLQIWFQTAWAPAILVMNELSTLFPEVDIEHRYIEEGDFFCGLYHVKNNISQDDSWDSEPNHNNVEEFGRECQCSWNDDQEYWYDDCPREEVKANA